MTNRRTLSVENRSVRPYRNLEPFEDLFSQLKLSVGLKSRTGGGIIRTDASSLAAEPFELHLPESFASSCRKALPETGLGEQDIVFLAVATTPYLRITDVLWDGDLEKLKESGSEIQLSNSDDRQRPLQATTHGVNLTFAAALCANRPRSPLTPHRKGTWLAKVDFNVITDVGDVGFTPLPMTDEVRDLYHLPRGAMRYVLVENVLDPTTTGDITVYVDETTLNTSLHNLGTSGSRAFQEQLLITAVTAVITEASHTLRKDGGRLTISDIGGSLIERLVRKAAGKDSTAEIQQRFLELIRDEPNRFATIVESWMPNLRRDFETAMIGTKA